MRIVILLTLTIIFGLLVAVRADAHTPAELDGWRTEWATRADEGLTVALRAEWADMRRRHPHHFTPPVRIYGWRVERWRPLIRRHFPDPQTAIRVLACESDGNPDARNRRSGASGLFQHLPRYWDHRAASAGLPAADPFDAEANVRVAAWLAATGGWSHWTCH